MKLLKLFNYKKPQTFLGVDIGSTSIQLLEISRIKQQYRIEHYAKIKMPEDKSLLTTNLKTTLQQIKSRYAAIAMPHSLVMMKNIQLVNSLTKTEIYEHIALKSTDYFGSAAAELNWDFNVLGPSKNHSNQIDIQLIAVRKKNLQERMAILTDVGLTVNVVDVETLALLRMTNCLHSTGKVLVIHVTALTLLTLSIEDKNLIYTQEKNWDTPPDTSFIATEIQQQLQLFIATDKCSALQPILLSGNDHNMVQIQQLLQRKNSAPVIIINPFSLISSPLAPDYPQDYWEYALSYGLALWNFV